MICMTISFVSCKKDDSIDAIYQKGLAGTYEWYTTYYNSVYHFPTETSYYYAKIFDDASIIIYKNGIKYHSDKIKFDGGDKFSFESNDEIWFYSSNDCILLSSFPYDADISKSINCYNYYYKSSMYLNEARVDLTYVEKYLGTYEGEYFCNYNNDTIQVNISIDIALKYNNCCVLAFESDAFDTLSPLKSVVYFPDGSRSWENWEDGVHFQGEFSLNGDSLIYRMTHEGNIDNIDYYHQFKGRK